MLPQTMWTRNFLLAQCFKVKDNVTYQDNQSSMKLENNGRHSSGKRTRHINIRYFFVTNKIGAKEVRIEYCPNELMIADFYTKPLQGALFIKMRNCIMGLDDAFCDERVEKRDDSDKPSRAQNTPQYTNNV